MRSVRRLASSPKFAARLSLLARITLCVWNKDRAGLDWTCDTPRDWTCDGQLQQVQADPGLGHDVGTATAQSGPLP